MSMGSTNVGIRHGMNSSPSIYPLTLSSVGGLLLSGDSEKRWKRWNLLVLTLFFLPFVLLSFCMQICMGVVHMLDS